MGLTNMDGQPPAQGPSTYTRYPVSSPGPPAPRSRWKWVWIGGAAALVIIALAFLLVFMLNRGDQGAAGGDGTGLTNPGVATTVVGAATPEQVTTQLLSALENRDLDAFLGLLDSTLLETLPTGAALDSAKEALKQELDALGTIRFSDIELSTTMNNETSATVTVTGGTVTVTGPDGKVTSQDVKDAPAPVIINLVLHDGKWYVASSPFL